MAIRTRNIAWLASTVLYALCWVLPILDDHIGYDGARVAHEEFWKLVTQGHPIEAPGDIFEIIFFAVGWLANELYVIGLVVVLVNPRIAVRLFAFALGVMISWHLPFLDKFPLLVGYWFWVLAGGTALWLAASRWAEVTGSSMVRVFAEPVTAALLLVPVLNAAFAASFGALK